jgi:hypothetical protein
MLSALRRASPLCALRLWAHHHHAGGYGGVRSETLNLDPPQECIQAPGLQHVLCTSWRNDNAGAGRRSVSVCVHAHVLRQPCSVRMPRARPPRCGTRARRPHVRTLCLCVRVCCQALQGMRRRRWRSITLYSASGAGLGAAMAAAVAAAAPAAAARCALLPAALMHLWMLCWMRCLASTCRWSQVRTRAAFAGRSQDGACMLQTAHPTPPDTLRRPLLPAPQHSCHAANRRDRRHLGVWGAVRPPEDCILPRCEPAQGCMRRRPWLPLSGQVRMTAAWRLNLVLQGLRLHTQGVRGGACHGLLAERPVLKLRPASVLMCICHTPVHLSHPCRALPFSTSAGCW